MDPTHLSPDPIESSAVSEKERAWSADEITDLLREVELFHHLSDEDLRQIAGVVTQVDADEGETLFSEGEPADAYYVVARGAVDIVRGGGGRIEKLGERREGEGFGEMGLLADAPRSAGARAASEARLLRVAREDFQWLLGGDSLAYRVLRGLANALRSAEVRFASAETLEAGGIRRSEADSVSRAMQTLLLPKTAPRVEGFDVAAGTTVEETGHGGAVWDWLPMDAGRTAFLTFEVRQGGLPPAHHLGVARAVFRGLAGEGMTAASLLARANEALSGAAVEGVGQFVEVGLLILDAGGMEWASAGRVPGGIIRRDGSFVELGSHGPPLGMMGGFKYEATRVGLARGDTVFVLSHGNKGLFRGAADLIAELHGKPAGDVVASVHEAVRRALGEERSETSVLYARRH